jgi:hypothetical protein
VFGETDAQGCSKGRVSDSARDQALRSLDEPRQT